MSGRRGHGEGTIFRRKDGRWVGGIERESAGGERSRKWFYGRSRADVVRKLRDAQACATAGLPLPSERVTVERYLDWYASTVLPTPKMKESTAAQYRSVIEAYIKPHLGRVTLVKLSPQHIHGFQSALAREGRSASTVRYARAVLSGALRHAERMEMVSRNVVRLVDAPPKPRSHTDDALTLEEARRLLSTISGHRLEALVTVAMAVGLRRGEALALRWSDVDLDVGTLTVTGTLKRHPGGGHYVDRPKSGASAATIPLPKTCVSALVRHRKQQAQERLLAGPLWRDGDFVFTTPHGTPLDGSNVLKAWYRIADSAGIARRRFHALRHSAATLMWEQGVPLDVISATLRHSGLAITKDIYVLFRPEVMRSGADAMDRALGSG